MFNRSIIFLVAILSIAVSATADAKPRHQKHRAAAATIVCDDRGCSDQRLAARPTPRVTQATVRTKVRHAQRHRTVRPAAVRHTPRAAETRIQRTVSREVRAVRVQRDSAGVIVCNQQGCSDRRLAARAEGTTAPVEVRRMTDANGSDAAIIGGRPAGCPRAFCGCEASRYVFGEMRPELYLATNWIRKFPRTSPASGMAAVRSGHVMVLISHVGGNDWLVHDGNSGGGLTRRHVRSISGHVIVNPQGSRSAQYQ